MRTILTIVLVSLAVMLAVIAGSRIELGSVDVLAIVVGCIAGIAAGIPVSVLLLLAMHKREVKRMRQAELERERSRYQARNWPRIVSISELIESGREERDDNLSQ